MTKRHKGQFCMKMIRHLIQYIKSLFSTGEKMITVSTEPAPAPAPAPASDYFEVRRGDMVSDRIATYDEVKEFLGDCGFEDESGNFLAAMAGVPFEIDGATMRFVRMPEGFVPPAD